MAITLINLSDNAILGVNNHNRVDHNNFGGGDDSNSRSWNRSRGGRRQHGSNHGKDKGGKGGKGGW
jgi:hypothetical protein